MLAQVMLAGAVFRAVLQPQDRRFLYLRLSGQEGWLTVCILVLMLFMVIAMVVVMIPLSIIFAIAMVASGGGGEAGGVLASILIGFAALAALTWGLLRFSMAPLMSFSDRNLRLFESWTFTRGHAWRMFLVGLSLTAITLLAEIVLVIAGALLVNAVVPLASIPSAFAEDSQGLLRRLGPAWLAAMVVLTPLGTALYVLYAAAWAEMYRQLANREADVF
jgi:hypothetical protein